LLGAYAGVAVLVAIDVMFGPVHVGILSVIPPLMIGFYGSRSLAVGSALACAAIFAALDNDVVRPIFVVRWTIETDGVFLAQVRSRRG